MVGHGRDRQIDALAQSEQNCVEQADLAQRQPDAVGSRLIAKWRSLGKSEKSLFSNGLPISTGQQWTLIHKGLFLRLANFSVSGFRVRTVLPFFPKPPKSATSSDRPPKASKTCRG
jgi:hypothetical protein